MNLPEGREPKEEEEDTKMVTKGKKKRRPENSEQLEKTNRSLNETALLTANR